MITMRHPTSIENSVLPSHTDCYDRLWLPICNDYHLFHVQCELLLRYFASFITGFLWIGLPAPKVS